MLLRAGVAIATSLLGVVSAAESVHYTSDTSSQSVGDLWLADEEDGRTFDDVYFNKPVTKLGGGDDDKNNEDNKDNKNEDKNGDTTSFTQGNFDNMYIKKGSYNKVMVMFLENCYYGTIMKYMSNTIQSSYYLKQYYGVGYPSQPNYIGILGGSTFGVNSDDQVYLGYDNIVDQLENAGFSWKAYMENYSGGCDLSEFQCANGEGWGGTQRDNNNRRDNRGRRMAGGDDKEGENNNNNQNGCYARKHNGFFAYTDITKDQDRCEKVVSGDQWKQDWKNGDLSNFMWYTPNLVNNGHDTGCEYGSNYLQEWLNTYFYGQEQMQDVLLFITWEADDGAYNNNVMGFFPTDDDHLYMTSAEAGSDIGLGLNPNSYQSSHYSMLKLIQENFGLGTLGRYDTWSNPIVMPYTCYSDDGSCSGSYKNASLSYELESYYPNRPTPPDEDSSSTHPIIDQLPWNQQPDEPKSSNTDDFLTSMAFKAMVSASFICICTMGLATCRACCRSSNDKNEPLLGVTRSDSLLSNFSRASLMSHAPTKAEPFPHVGVNGAEGFTSVHRTNTGYLGAKKTPALDRPLDAGPEWEGDPTLPQSEDIAASPWDPQNLTQEQFAELLQQEALESQQVVASGSLQHTTGYQPPRML